MTTRYRNRMEAGQILATLLTAYANRQDVLILALPRGGVPVAYEVTKALRAPLDVFLVRKLGVPGQEELAMGAIATGGVRVINENVVLMLNIPERVINAVAAKEQEELKRREEMYRDNLPPVDVHGYTVILIDDGLATGSTMRAAIQALRQKQPARIVVASPVATASVCEELSKQVDEIACITVPEELFYGIGFWYEDFSQITDGEVRDLLARSKQEIPPATPKL